jgi:hypothetical protein
MTPAPIPVDLATDHTDGGIGSDAWLSHTCPADAYRLAEAGQCACGQAALAAALGRNASDLLHAFPGPGLWVNDARMYHAIKTLGVMHEDVTGEAFIGMAVSWLQGLGPWMRTGLPIGARNQRTHWVAECGDAVYDLNADSWLPRVVWKTQVLPELLEGWKAKYFEVRKTFLVWDNVQMQTTPDSKPK